MHKSKSFDIFIILFLFVISLLLANDKNDNLIKEFLDITNTKDMPASALITQRPAVALLSTLTPTPKIAYSGIYQDTNGQWGVAKQLSEHTWTLKIGQDAKMATPREIFTALNNYRQNHGAGALSWSDSLANFAQLRADFFIMSGDLDEHAGFYSYLDSPENQKKVGFNDLGENSSIGYNLEAVHLIEWVYASDEGHNKNQLNNRWTHVGIGVSGGATDIIFGE